MNAFGVIFSHIQNENIDALARKRTVASVPFGGRYRLIDFALSNIVSAGIVNVGVIAQKEGLSTENWTDPERDIRSLKCKERYGIGILNNGRGITVARNIAVAPSYPSAPKVVVQTQEVK